MFFDYAGVGWAYEPVKVQIDSFRHYTPDFGLTVCTPPCLLEVKPTWEMSTDDTRLQRLSLVTTNLCLAACGEPLPLLYGRPAEDVRVYLVEDAEVTHMWHTGNPYVGEDLAAWIDHLHQMRSRNGGYS